jgi:hypothetical protein
MQVLEADRVKVELRLGRGGEAGREEQQGKQEFGH